VIGDALNVSIALISQFPSFDNLKIPRAAAVL